MKWTNPSVRLDEDEVYALLTIRGLDDWLQPADFFDLARYLGPVSEDAYRRSAVDLAERLIRQNHALPGDILSGEHRPWPGPGEDLTARVRALWSNLEVDARFAFVWFELTESGHTFAAEATKRVEEPD